MNKKIIIIFLILLFLFIAAGIFFSPTINQLITAGIFFLTTIDKEKDNEIKVERTERQLAHSELLIKDIEVGIGSAVKTGDKVTAHYTGMLEDGTVFDSSYDKGRTFTFTVGQGQVIPGWEIGIEGMKKEGRRRLVIPPELGYGESGVRGMIPPNSVIIFEIELVGIE